MAWTDDVTGNGYGLTDGSAVTDHYDVNTGSPTLLSPTDGNAYHKTNSLDHSSINGALYRNNADLNNMWGSGSGTPPNDISFTTWVYTEDAWQNTDTLFTLNDYTGNWTSAKSYLHMFGYSSSTDTYHMVRYSQVNAGDRALITAGDYPRVGEWCFIWSRCYQNGSYYDFQIGLKSATTGEVDGSVYTTLANSSFVSMSADYIHFGAYVNSGECPKHNVEQFCIWNKKLSDAEIDSLYNSGSGRELVAGDTTNLHAAYWADYASGVQPYMMHHINHNCQKDPMCGLGDNNLLRKPTLEEIANINRRYR